MAVAGKNDPLKKQKDSIPMKNAAIEKYLKSSKEYFSDFDQKKDTVISTRGKNTSILRTRHGRKTNKFKDWGTEKFFTDRKTGETIMATKIKKANK